MCALCAYQVNILVVVVENALLFTSHFFNQILTATQIVNQLHLICNYNIFHVRPHSATTYLGHHSTDLPRSNSGIPDKNVCDQTYRHLTLLPGEEQWWPVTMLPLLTRRRRHINRKNLYEGWGLMIWSGGPIDNGQWRVDLLAHRTGNQQMWKPAKVIFISTRKSRFPSISWFDFKFINSATLMIY